MFNNTAERKNFLLEMYDANYQVGDIYETIALVTFGNLVMDYLMTQIKMHQSKADQALEEHATQEMARGNSGVAAKAEREAFDSVLDQMKESMKTLTTFGVKLFAGTCAIQGGYNVIVTGFGFYFPDFQKELFSRDLNNPGALQTEAMKKYVHDFCLGMSMVSSCAAISNVMFIEEAFHGLLKKFQPSMKFWGTKILVSLAAVQSCAEFMPPFTGWFPSEVQWGVFYSSMLSLECLLIALFHIKGWDADEQWYEQTDKVESLGEPLMQSQSKIADPS